MLRKVLLGLAILVAGCAAPGASQPQAPATSTSDVTLPPDVVIVPPGPGVAKSVAFYSGKWVGSWGGTLNHTLVVERIAPTFASIVYAWGNNASYRITSGAERGTATFEGKNLVFHGSSGKITVVYVPQPDGSLAATYDNPVRGWHSTAIMTKVSN